MYIKTGAEGRCATFDYISAAQQLLSLSRWGFDQEGVPAEGKAEAKKSNDDWTMSMTVN